MILTRNYNPDGKRGNVSREKAMEELLQVVRVSKPVVIRTSSGTIYVTYQTINLHHSAAKNSNKTRNFLILLEIYMLVENVDNFYAKRN